MTRVCVNTQIPWMLGRSTLTLSRQSKEKGHQVRAIGILISAVEQIFNDTAMQARTPASNRLAKAIRAGHGPRVSLQSQAKERVKRTMEHPKDISKESKGAKGSGEDKTSKTGISGFENLKSENKLGNSGISANGTGFVPLTRRGFKMNGVLMKGTTAGIWMELCWMA